MTKNTKLAPAHANRVAAQLRSAGFNPVSPANKREGVKVKHGLHGSCLVVVDVDDAKLVETLRAQLVETLNELGYTTRVAADVLIYVEGRRDDSEPATHPLIAIIPASELRAGHVLAPHPSSPAAKSGRLSATLVVAVTRWPNGNGVSFECAPGSGTLRGDYPNSSDVCVYLPEIARFAD